VVMCAPWCVCVCGRVCTVVCQRVCVVMCAPWCVCVSQLIDMLDQRVSMQHGVLVQCAVTAARTNEMQLESDVLRHKLSQLMYVYMLHSVSQQRI